MSKQERLLDWVTRTPNGVLESQIVASGMSRALDELLLQAKVTMVPHETVKDKNGLPVMVVVLKEDKK